MARGALRPLSGTPGNDLPSMIAESLPTEDSIRTPQLVRRGFGPGRANSIGAGRRFVSFAGRLRRCSRVPVTAWVMGGPSGFGLDQGVEVLADLVDEQAPGALVEGSDSGAGERPSAPTRWVGVAE